MGARVRFPVRATLERRGLGAALLLGLLAGSAAVGPAPVQGQRTPPIPSGGPDPVGSGDARAPRGWIGISFSYDRDPRSAAAGEGGVLIGDVFRGSPAARAGIRPGDRVLRIDGEDVDVPALLSFARSLTPGDTLSLLLGGERGAREVTLVTGARPDAFAPFRDPDFSRVVDSLRTAVARTLDSVRLEVPAAPTAVDLDRIAGSGDAHRLPLRLRALQTDLVSTRRALARVRGRIDELESRSREVEDPQRGVLERIRLAQERRAEELETEVRGVEAALQELYGELGTFGDVLPPGAGPRPPAPPRGGAISPGGARWPEPEPPAPYTVGRNYVAGARMTALNPSLSEYFDVDGGVLILEVIEESPAGEAGLRPGDVIVAVEGTEYGSVDALRSALLRRGRAPATLTVVRKGETLRVEL